MYIYTCRTASTRSNVGIHIIHIHTYIHTYIHTCRSAYSIKRGGKHYTYTYKHTYIHTYRSVSTRSNVGMDIIHIHAYIHTYIYTCRSASTRSNVGINSESFKKLSKALEVCIYIYIYIYIYILESYK